MPVVDIWHVDHLDMSELAIVRDFGRSLPEGLTLMAHTLPGIDPAIEASSIQVMYHLFDTQAVNCPDIWVKFTLDEEPDCSERAASLFRLAQFIHHGLTNKLPAVKPALTIKLDVHFGTGHGILWHGKYAIRDW